MFKVGEIVEQAIQTKSIPKHTRGEIMRVWTTIDPQAAWNAYEVKFTGPAGSTYRLRYENELVPLHATPQQYQQAQPTQPVVNLKVRDRVMVTSRSHPYYGHYGIIVSIGGYNTTIVSVDVVLDAVPSKAMGFVPNELTIHTALGTTPGVTPAPSPWAQGLNQKAAQPQATMSCQHDWKERILFISKEEYCTKCPAFRPIKAS